MAVKNTYDKGDLVRCSGAFTDGAGDAIDPVTVVFKYKDPGGNVTTLTYGTDAALKRSSVGNYYVDVDANASGSWYYRFESTGSGQAADEYGFDVPKSEF